MIAAPSAMSFPFVPVTHILIKNASVHSNGSSGQTFVKFNVHWRLRACMGAWRTIFK